MKVFFDDTKHVKPPTVVNTIIESTLQRDENEIQRCKSIEEISEIGDRLLSELEELQKKKKQGYDIYQQFEDLQYKFSLAKEVKAKIQKSNETKAQLSRQTSKDIAYKHQNCSNNERKKTIAPKNELNDDYKHNKQIVPKNELNDEWLEKSAEPKSINEAIFRYLSSYNSYQILFVFYNCDRVSRNDYAYYVDEIFKRYSKHDLQVAMCSFEGNFIAFTEFLNDKSFVEAQKFTKERPLKSLKEFLNDIPSLNWSPSSRKMKIVNYITSRFTSKKEIDDLISAKNSASDFIEFKRIRQYSFEFTKSTSGHVGSETFRD